MAENKEMRSQRLTAVEAQEAVVEKAKHSWQDAKDSLAQARKGYEKQIDGLCGMIRERSSTPLFDDETEAAE